MAFKLAKLMQPQIFVIIFDYREKKQKSENTNLLSLQININNVAALFLALGNHFLDYKD